VNSFDMVWSHLQMKLKPDMVIPNWTAYKGYLGDTMKIFAVRSNYIVIDSPNAKTFQSVPKDNFENVWEVWPDYKAQKVRRYEITDVTRFSKYIIGIFHWYENA
jgi:hypothetical protein